MKVDPLEAATGGALRLEYMPLDQLLAWPSNAKDHDVGLIDTSINRFGFVDPILICERAHRIAGGHGRQKALHAQMIGGAAPPFGVMLGEDGMWRVPVVRGWRSKSDRELDALTVALNQATIAGGWDDPKLMDILSAIQGGTDAGLEGTGFDDQDFEDLRSDLADGAGGVDEAPPLPKDPWVKVGDLWQLGEHRLMCGNSTQRAEVQALLRGESIDCVLTDPPYCSGGFQEADRIQGSIGTSKRDYTGQHVSIANDVLSTRGYKALIAGVLDVWNSKIGYVFTDWRMWTNLTDVMESQGFGIRSMIVWDKGTPGMGRGWLSQHELIAVGTRIKSPFPQNPAHGNVITCERSGNEHHPTEKPVKLLRAILENTAIDIGRAIADPFVGSGSTIVACEAIGRVCYAMELSPYFAQVAIERWQSFTGKTAERLEEGTSAAGIHATHGQRRIRAAAGMKRNPPARGKRR